MLTGQRTHRLSAARIAVPVTMVVVLALVGSTSPADAARHTTDSLPSAAEGTSTDIQVITEPLHDLPAARAAGAAAKRAAIGQYGVPDPRFPLPQTFALSSYPTSTKTIYLDFLGGTLTNTYWNDATNARTIVVAPYNTDQNATSFSNQELAQIQYIWEVVAADFAPFDVNVTTKKPTEAAMTASSPTDPTWGRTNIITSDDGGAISGICSCSGFAATADKKLPYDNLDAFNDTVASWTFSGNLGMFTWMDAELVSHELGHQFGLMLHDGDSRFEYHPGSTLWGTIMGNPGGPLSQWSRGEYLDANNTMDELAAISKSLGYRTDTVEGTAAGATPISVSDTAPPLAASIEQTGDVDAFAFTADRDFDLEVTPSGNAPNLDLRATVLDSATGAVVRTIDNPDFSVSHYEASGLDASAAFTHTGPSRRYTVLVTGTGSGAPGEPNYFSAYASLGDFTIAVRPGTGEKPTMTDQPLKLVTHGEIFQVGSNSPASQAIGAAGGSGVYRFDFVGRSPEVATNSWFESPGATLSFDAGGPKYAGKGTIPTYLVDSHGALVHEEVPYEVRPDPTNHNPTVLSAGSLGSLTTGAKVTGARIATRAGGVRPFTWKALYLPAGLELDPDTGTVSGTVLRSGSGVAWIAVSDSTGTGSFVEVPWTVKRDPANSGNLEILSATTIEAQQGAPFEASFTTSGADGVFWNDENRDTYRWSISGAPMKVTSFIDTPGPMGPAGRGILVGTPTAPGTYQLTVTATSGAGVNTRTGSRVLTLQIRPRLAFETKEELPAGRVGEAYRTDLVLTGGSGQLRIDHSPLPTGLRMKQSVANPRILVLSGTPRRPGKWRFGITATDEAQGTAKQAFTLRIRPAPQ